MTTSTANGRPAEAVVPAETRLDGVIENLHGELTEAVARRDLLKGELKQAETLVERIDRALKALGGHHTGPGRPKTTGGAHTKVSEEIVQLVEATLARHDEPVSIPALAGEFPHRHESSIRTAVYYLRDQGRVRLVDQKGERQSARYGLMPEVKAEHA